MCKTGRMEVLQALGCPVQLLSCLVNEVAGIVESHTSSSLLAGLFLMKSMMFPCAIHSDTATNCPFIMSP